MLTSDADRAEAIAEELNRANSERRFAEREALAGAQSALTALPDEVREAPAVVIAGEGWHPGVVGIVASRMVELHWRPAIVIGLGEDGRGRGSGRSIPGFDLLAGLEACGEHAGAVRRPPRRRRARDPRRERRGLPRAPSPSTRPPSSSPADLVRSQAVDAIVGGESLGLPIAEELELLAPFGKGNPEPRLLVPAARVQRRAADGGGGTPRPLQPAERRAAGARGRVRRERGARPRRRGRAARRRGEAGAEPLERLRRAARRPLRALRARAGRRRRPLGGRRAGAARPRPSRRSGGAASTPRWRPTSRHRRRARPAHRPARWSTAWATRRWRASRGCSRPARACSRSAPTSPAAPASPSRAADPSRFGGGEAVLACGRCAVDPMAARARRAHRVRARAGARGLGRARARAGPRGALRARGGRRPAAVRRARVARRQG